MTPTPQLTAKVVLAVLAFSLGYVGWVLAYYFLTDRPDATVTHVVRGWWQAWPPLRWLLLAALLWLAYHLCA